MKHLAALGVLILVFASGCTSTGYTAYEQPAKPSPQEAVKEPAAQKSPQMGAPAAFSWKGSQEYCYSGKVTRIIDGDTIDVDNARVRLVLIDAPETYEPGGAEATSFVVQNCPVGSEATIDQDDWQLYDSYDRMLGVVYCNGMNLNKEMLSRNYAGIFSRYCSSSEFGTEDWAIENGC